MKKKLNHKTVLCIFAFLCSGSFPYAQTQENKPQSVPMVVRKSSGVFQKSAVKRVLPQYPAQAKAQGISGEVLIEVKTDKDGSVMATTPVSGNQLLAEAAMQALREWKFTPTQLSGVAVQVVGVIGFIFTKEGKVIEKTSSAPAGVVGTGSGTETFHLTPSRSLLGATERADLLQKLQTAYDIGLHVNNPENVVLEISKASVRAVRREEKDLATDAKSAGYKAEFAMQATVEIHNKTTKVITGAGFKFTNIETRQIFFSYPDMAPINPQETRQIHYDLVILSGNPASLQVELVGVRFADGQTGGAFPNHPQLSVSSPPPENPKVDAKPRPLNRLRPDYTDEAIHHKITGAVRLQIKIGADGAVKDVQVLNALPDGLTEEAIRIARVLQFQPAMSSGAPIEYSILVDVEFKLQ